MRELLWLLAHGSVAGRVAAAAALAAGAADARNRELFRAARVLHCMLQVHPTARSDAKSGESWY